MCNKVVCKISAEKEHINIKNYVIIISLEIVVTICFVTDCETTVKPSEMMECSGIELWLRAMRCVLAWDALLIKRQTSARKILSTLVYKWVPTNNLAIWTSIPSRDISKHTPSRLMF